MADAGDTLEPLRVALRGSHLIEASAGTGKTWTIAALYLRLVLGHGSAGSAAEPGTAFARPLVPPEILVMTFTVAATRELSDRIRARLVEAARCFRGEREPAAGDDYLRALIDGYPPGEARSGAAWRLAAAAESMDDAAVHTIDAWCQRMLREHAVDSGSLFDEELLVDEFAHVDDAVRDYWRRNVYPLDAAALGRVHDVWPGGAAGMSEDVRELMRHDGIEADLAASLDDVRLAVEGDAIERTRWLKEGWVERATEMQRWFDEQLALSPSPLSGSKVRADWPAKRTGALRLWASSPGVTFPDLDDAHWHRLAPDGLRDAARARHRIDPPVWSADTVALHSALAGFVSPKAAMRRHATASVRHRVAELKKAAGTPGFRDLLERLAGALDGPNGDRLRARIVAQFPAALIDEFQDTSPLQYRIFDRVYRIEANDPATSLFLIGDPKQSIFAFRGADIRSYLKARAATAGRHHRLGTNHRSTAELVAAVNQLFHRAERHDGGAFRYGGALDPSGPSPLPFVPVAARGRRERLVASAGAMPALVVHHDAGDRSTTDLRRAFAHRAAAHVVSLLNDPTAGFEDESAAFRRLRPADIAVLVRTGSEAEAVRAALGGRKVASVYLSDRDSVFDADEAKDLVRWLLAVASPLDSRRVRAAFATSLLGLPIAELAALANDDAAFERRVELLRRLKTTWARQGVLPMLRQALHELELPARWLAEPDGERKLTNVLHLAELLQAASAEVEGEETLIRWLGDQIEHEHSGEDETLVRLESDADLIKVVTIHKAKGLEYPIVVLPFAGAFREEKEERGVVVLPGDGSGRRVVFDPSDPQVAEADRARHQEDLRLFYVAATRARHALWIGVAAQGVKKNGSNDFHHSAIGHLVAGTSPVGAGDVFARLRAAVEGLAGVAVVPAEDEPSAGRLEPRDGGPAFVDALPYATRFETDWSIGSFSGLVRDLSRLSLVAGAAADPALEEELLVAGDEPPAPPATSGNRPARHRFPRGALPGNFLHDQLEWLAGARFALTADPELADRLRRRCERQGWGNRADDVVAWLGEVVTTPLPPIGVPLAGLTTLLPEMEFWFPSERLDAARIDALCSAHLFGGRPRPALAKRSLHGMVMGFADLVFEQDGRYWVLDHKSNALGEDDAAYDTEALEAAMAEHRYDVQAALYLLALHRLLRARLGASYRPEQHLGGAIYLFLRGVRGPANGCCVVTPPAALLDALDAELGTRGAAAGVQP